MILRHLALLSALACAPAFAESIWLSPQEFEALVQGKATRVFDDTGAAFGTEYFLPGRRVIWQYADEDACIQGSWTVKRDAVCYAYENGATNCLRYFEDAGTINGIEWVDGTAAPGQISLKLIPGVLPACPFS